MSELPTLLDIAIDNFIEHKDQIQHFCMLNEDIQNQIIKRECRNVVTERIQEAEKIEKDPQFNLYFPKGLNCANQSKGLRQKWNIHETMT